jgi:16S rRNA (guanine1207-N2)-methyltransferase
VGQHYFTEDPAAAHRPGLVQVVLRDRHFECATDAGVFSASRLDPGTRVLLDTVPPPPSAGQLLDLGTGYGPIALAMAARVPGATVWAVDVNTRALELCAGNAARAGLGNVRCVPPGDPALPATFGGIWSNPPIRIGKEALHRLLAGWLGRLDPGGRAYLVVQRNLGADSLHRWLGEQGWPTARIASRAGYRVLEVTAR